MAAGSVGGRLRHLYREVAEVRWEQLPDPASAAVREADLIVALRPVCNASYAGEGRWNYVTVQPVGPRVRLALSPDLAHPTGRTYGCFPHLGRGVSSPPAIACSDGYAAFLRLLWAASPDPASTFPSRITRSAPDVFDVEVPAAPAPLLHTFLSGTSDRLLGQLAAAAATRRPPHFGPGLVSDHAAARSFFVHGPQAVRRLRLRHRQPPGPLSRERIEGLLVAELTASIGPFRLRRPDPADALLGRRARPWATP